VHFVIFCHSLLSDWNHGNAHFLRGVAGDLIRRGHHVSVYEPYDAWSVRNLIARHGAAPLRRFHDAYPGLSSSRYDPATFDVEAALDTADVVLVHEWNDPALVARIGAARAAGGDFRLLFHDTHHRASTAPDEMRRFELQHYDGVLAFGSVIRDIYLTRGWAQRAWTWHEAADTTVFHPVVGEPAQGDVVWIGNWGDDERSAELATFLIEPVQQLGLRGTVHGVRYPAHARHQLAAAGISYAGWLPNFDVPAVFARHRVTVHVPRRPYVQALPGIPTIRPFEALACGIPLISAPWDDVEGLFRAGTDYVVARDGAGMRHHLRTLLHDPDRASALADSGRRRVLERHTCRHRVDELLGICRALAVDGKELIAS
jgi:spore maturation protein CgeB